MRALFLFLLLANMAFYAWVNHLRTPVSAAAHIQQVQITPEKIRLVDAPAPAASVATAGQAIVSQPATCIEWGAFVGLEAARGDTAMAELKLPSAQWQRVASDLDGHWVMIPPLKSRAEAERMTERLKHYGVTDYSLVQEPPQRRSAISLGMFRTEAAAQNALSGLQKRGVIEASIEKRQAFFQRVVFFVREPDAALVSRLSALQTVHPGTTVKAVDCPAD